MAQARLIQTIFGLSCAATGRCAPTLEASLLLVGLAHYVLLVREQESAHASPGAGNS